MFVEDPDWGSLRQGDICTVPFVPYWDLKRTNTVMDPGGKAERLSIPSIKSAIGLSEQSPWVAVCTQCCDIAQAKGRMGVSVAPVRAVPASEKDPERLSSIMNSTRADSAGQWSWFHLFPLQFQPPDGTGDPILAVVDWSSMMTIGPQNEAVATLLASKRHEMTLELRDQFRTKLAISFGRPPEEDVSALQALADSNSD